MQLFPLILEPRKRITCLVFRGHIPPRQQSMDPVSDTSYSEHNVPISGVKVQRGTRGNAILSPFRLFVLRRTGWIKTQFPSEASCNNVGLSFCRSHIVLWVQNFSLPTIS